MNFYFDLAAKALGSTTIKFRLIMQSEMKEKAVSHLVLHEATPDLFQATGSITRVSTDPKTMLISTPAK